MDYLSHCTRCPTNVHCCQNIRSLGFVGTSIDEAKRINDHTGRAYNEFLEFTPLPAETIESCASDTPGSEGELRTAQIDDGRLLRLKTKENGDCIFLDESRKCTIYPARPGICRMYPFWYATDESGQTKITLYEEETACSVSNACKTKIPLSESETAELKLQASLLESQRIADKTAVREFVKAHTIQSTN